MNKNCKLCDGNYDFRMVLIGDTLGQTSVMFSSSKRSVNKQNAFNYCPVCGEKLTKENYGGFELEE